VAYRILLLPGDGVGPEVSAAARACLQTAAAAFGFDLQFEVALMGGAAIDACGDPLPEETLRTARESDAIFLGAVGGPQWDHAPARPEAGLLRLRAELGLFANLRPVRVRAGLERFSPLRPEIASGADVLIVRELTGGLYFGEKREGDDQAFDGCLYSRPEVARIADVAFKAAAGRKRRVTSVDKANVLATSRLWRRVVSETGSAFPDIAIDHLYVDAAAMKLVTRPGAFDVLLTENLFGDILSDEASVIAGSIGLLGSASLGADGPGVFEPIHGSAPDIAGQGVANPAGAIESAAMLLRYGLEESQAADALDAALDRALADGAATRDLGGSLSTQAFTGAVLNAFADRAAA